MTSLLKPLSSTMTAKLPVAFVRLLEENGVALAPFGIQQKALKPSAAMKAVLILQECGRAVVGAEAWQSLQNGVVPTLDSWNIEREDFHSHHEYLRESWARAQAHIERYLDREDILITIGF